MSSPYVRTSCQYRGDLHFSSARQDSRVGSLLHSSFLPYLDIPFSFFFSFFFFLALVSFSSFALLLVPFGSFISASWTLKEPFTTIILGRVKGEILHSTIQEKKMLFVGRILANITTSTLPLGEAEVIASLSDGFEDLRAQNVVAVILGKVQLCKGLSVYHVQGLVNCWQ